MEKTKEKVLKKLESLVYLEHDDVFTGSKVSEGKEKIVQFKSIQRANGAVEGVISKFEPKNKLGEIEIEGCKVPFIYESSKRFGTSKKEELQKSVGKFGKFSFWPTQENYPKGQQKKITPLKICNLRVSEIDPNYVEVRGKLEKVWPSKFVISVYSLVRKKTLYILFWGKYPNEKDVDKFVRIEGKFNPKSQVIEFERTTSVKFLSEKEIKEFLKRKAEKTQSYLPLKDFNPTPEMKPIEIEISKIIFPNKEARSSINPKKLEETKNSFKTNLKDVKPIVVKETRKKNLYHLRDGLKRVIAAFELEHKTIQAYIIQGNFKTKNKKNKLKKQKGGKTKI